MEYAWHRNGRFFTDFTEKSFGELIGAYSEIEMIEEWVSADARLDRGNEKWLNITLRKKETMY